MNRNFLIFLGVLDIFCLCFAFTYIEKKNEEKIKLIKEINEKIISIMESNNKEAIKILEEYTNDL